MTYVALNKGLEKDQQRIKERIEVTIDCDHQLHAHIKRLCEELKGKLLFFRDFLPSKENCW